MNNEITAIAGIIAELSDDIRRLTEERKVLRPKLEKMMIDEGLDRVGRCYWGFQARTAVYSEECQSGLDELQATINECKEKMSELKSEDKQNGTMISPAKKMVFVKKS